MNRTLIFHSGPKVDVVLIEAIGFSCKQMEKINEAMRIICNVVNSDKFAERVKQLTFTHTKHDPDLVLKNIYEARELNSEADSEIDLSLRYYNSWWSRVIGYTLPKSMWIWMNWKYHGSFKPEQIASNLFHEWLHKIGYDHASAKDHKSVPYALGYLLEELAVKYA